MADPTKVAIYGAGGFAREVAWLLSFHERLSRFRVVGYVQDASAATPLLNGKPVIDWDTLVSSHRDAAITIAVGDPAARERLASKCSSSGFAFVTLVHHSVEISDYVELGPGAIICCGCVLTVNIALGSHVHINLDCTIGHDVAIGDFTTLAPGVHVSGNVRIGKHVYVGTGATIINGTSENPLIVGDGTVIGAGACVTRSTEPNCLYAGVPAVLKKQLTSS